MGGQIRRRERQKGDPGNRREKEKKK